MVFARTKKIASTLSQSWRQNRQQPKHHHHQQQKDPLKKEEEESTTSTTANNKTDNDNDNKNNNNNKVHTVQKIYLAKVKYHPPYHDHDQKSGTINLPLGPSTTERLKWQVLSIKEGGKPCQTLWSVYDEKNTNNGIEEDCNSNDNSRSSSTNNIPNDNDCHDASIHPLDNNNKNKTKNKNNGTKINKNKDYGEIMKHKPIILMLRPITGRTHQLRIHCASGGSSGIIGDSLYGDEPIEFHDPSRSTSSSLSKEGEEEKIVKDVTSEGKGSKATTATAVSPSSSHHHSMQQTLCLHAYKLSFPHPKTGKVVEFISPKPSWCY